MFNIVLLDFEPISPLRLFFAPSKGISSSRRTLVKSVCDTLKRAASTSGREKLGQKPFERSDAAQTVAGERNAGNNNRISFAVAQ